MRKYMILLLICGVLKPLHANRRAWPSLTHDDPERKRDRAIADRLHNAMKDVIRDTTLRIHALARVRLNSVHSPSHEIGYISYLIQEKYRQMTDKYFTSRDYAYNFYSIEILLYLEEIEHKYWELEHLLNMIHEVERKYNVTTGLNETFVETTTVITTTTTIVIPRNKKTRDPKKRKRKRPPLISEADMKAYIKAATTHRPKHRYGAWKWPKVYGWDYVAQFPDKTY